jgi:hypothetical protein
LTSTVEGGGVTWDPLTVIVLAVLQADDPDDEPDGAPDGAPDDATPAAMDEAVPPHAARTSGTARAGTVMARRGTRVTGALRFLLTHQGHVTEVRPTGYARCLTGSARRVEAGG